MRFWLLDRICSFEPNTELTAIKNVSLSEDYLADHFPEFPVLPGVFMLEAATQAGAWLIRLSENYAHSVIELHEAKAVKFADFVTPGRTLQMRVQQKKRDGQFVHLRFEGKVEGRTCVSGRLILACSNLAEGGEENDHPELVDVDKRMIKQLRTMEILLTKGSNISAVAV